MLKKFAILSLFLVLGIFLVSSTSLAGDKIDVCHRTGSASNPVVLINISSNAVPSHLNHGDSLLPTGAVDCSGGGGGGGGNPI